MFGTEKNPKSPSFSRAKRVEKIFSGTKLCFVVPELCPPFFDPSWNSEPDSLEFSDQERFEPVRAAGDSIVSGLTRAKIYSGSWEFRGLPILQGYCGSVNCLFEIKALDDLPINESLFDKQVLTREVYDCLQQVSLNDLGEGYSDDELDMTSYWWPKYLAPLNAQWVARGGVDWLYYENQPLSGGSESIVWITPVSNNHYLSLCFFIDRSARNAGNSYRIEQRIPRDNYLSFMHKIVDSIQLDLSPSAKAELNHFYSGKPEQSKPIFESSAEQIDLAKYVLYMHSGDGYDDRGGDPDKRHRAKPEEVAAFIDLRVKANPLPGSYVAGLTLQDLVKEPESNLKAD